MNETKLLSDALKVLKIEDSNSISSLNSDFSLKTKDGQTLQCFIPAATYIGKISAYDGFVGNTKEEQAGVYQWLEYCLLHSNFKDKEMLSDLNGFLKDKVYFVGNRYTIADLLLYLSLHEVYYKMSFQEKELYCNLSRWFRLVQNEARATDLYPKIYFSKTLLYT